ncbi:MAG: TrkA family potassium uptake protein [Chloroflexi bacterium]|nr:TrkA family potassium uptake protein [Chloroflexota bacterium]
MRVIIVGGGKTGSYLANLLLEGHHDVTVIEHRTDVLAKLQRELSAKCVVAGDGTEPAVLEEAGIAGADVLAAVTGDDETNLVATNLARFEFEVPRVIARVNNPRNAWLFTPAMGVDVAVNQADLMARLIAEEMSLGDMMMLMKLRRGKVAIVEEKIDAGAPADGHVLSDLSIPSGSNIMAVIRKDEVIVPDGSTRLQAGDEIIAIVRSDMAPMLARLFGNPSAS